MKLDDRLGMDGGSTPRPVSSTIRNSSASELWRNNTKINKEFAKQFQQESPAQKKVQHKWIGVLIKTKQLQIVAKLYYV